MWAYINWINCCIVAGVNFSMAPNAYIEKMILYRLTNDQVSQCK